MDNIAEGLNNLKSYIGDSFAHLLQSIERGLKEQTVEILQAIQAYYSFTVLPVLTGLATGIAELIGAVAPVTT